ncbi:transcriptional repressor NF-X1 [[Emmonsia] crescens]|uniref:Transcriptional repressor NF-X1 n=1 Tax=[Emmonsia] crescens TaxID=73230 RepID=A0A2B7Z797_9EURO|nr:transcriptional repressor NF-X1 [Emmonsia crescens]
MTTTEIASQSSTAQIPPLDQTPARDERLNPNNSGPRRPGRRGRGGNRGSGGNVNPSRNRPLFQGRGGGGGGGGGGPGRGGAGAGTGTGTGTGIGTGTISRRGRGRGRGDAPNTTRTVAGIGRSFGGRLTREDPEAVEDGDGERSLVQGDQGSLRPNAPEFIPGVQLPTSTSMPIRERTRQPRPTKAKSTAHDIATRTHEDIAHGVYECPICTIELGRKTKVWSCSLCWTVFHLSCIKKWTNNEGSVMARPRQQQGHEDGQDHPRQWRCPGCNLPHDILPSTYTCWCEKETDPRPLPGLPPHSCGQSCSKARKGCPHPCDSVCHAGPCPPCAAMGPTQSCFCGRHESTKKCVDTDYETGWSCREPCGELLPCLEHKCARPCHEGLCGVCEEIVDARCYCGKCQTKMMCSNREEESQSRLTHGEGASEESVEEWVGCFDCREICDRPYDCGIHKCQKRCHPQDAAMPHCPSSPDVIAHCACGKTPLSDIPGYKPRTSCQDPIPNCKEPCGKLLPCQHPCPVPCHTGPCPPCFLRVSINCRCGKGSFQSICHQGVIEPPQCFRVCKATMNCGRHTCGERCCPGERKAIERQATKRKLKSLNVVNRPHDNDIEAEHICTRLCGRMLKCSKHTCQELCHKGSCSTCREAIFEEISCNCGRSVLYPPLPCGTRPPPCHYDCAIPKSCGHPQTSHNCHTDDESCPKCPFLTEKRCLCTKKTLKNQPCWLTDPRCGLVCGKELKCGSHTCKNHCHRPGECEDSTEPCHQPCGKIKKLCSHPCSDPCHAPFPCQEKTPCRSLIKITCPCGRLKQEKRCNASRDNKNRLQQQESQSPSPLKCDDECGRLQRNRSLASALNISIDPLTTSATADGDSLTTTTTATLPYSPETLDLYLTLSTTSTLSTLQTYETTLHTLATSQTQRTVRFPPARSQLRAFIHSLAADWGFKSESYDPEPHRHVAVFKNAHWVPPHGLGAEVAGAAVLVGIGIGGVTVGECAKMRERERAREREARRAAVAAVEKSMVETRAVYEIGDGGFGASSSAGGDGWAQVASRKRPAAGLLESAFGFGEVGVGVGNGRGILGGVRGGSGAASGKSGTLVLRSGVGIGGKGKAVASGSGGGSEGGWRKFPAGFAEDVVDDWEEEVEREEREEEREKGPLNVSENGEAQGEAQGEEQDEEVGIANEIANRNGDEDRVPSPSIHPSIG